MKIVVLTGAGISAESGLATFRDADGAWNRFDVMAVATPEGYSADPARVHCFYDRRRAQLAEVEPNAAHRALAALERAVEDAGGAFLLVTQNVDDLHERGGSRHVLHMHGELRRARCTGCEAVMEWDAPMGGDAGGPGRGAPCPRCGEALRPHVVWFGEIPFGQDRIERAIADADWFVAIGTSGEVYPAAGYTALARRCGTRTLEINLAASGSAAIFDERRYGPATETVPAWVADVREHLSAAKREAHG